MQMVIKYVLLFYADTVVFILYTNCTFSQKIWDDWMREMTPIFAQTPYMAVEGNHESEHHFAAYNHRFRNPSEGN